MSKQLEMYLKKINEDTENESVGGFAIDSFPTKANKRPLPVIYPGESIHPDELKNIEEDIDADTNFNIDEKRILIDFDQVIHKYSVGWIDNIIYDEPIPGAKEAIQELRDLGFKVIIFTSRLSETTQGIDTEHDVNEQRKMIEEWLDKYDIEVDGMTAEKLPATLYIDDRAYCFTGVWNNKTMSEIKKKIDENLISY